MQQYYLQLAQPFYIENDNYYHTFNHAKKVYANVEKIISNLKLPYLLESALLSAAFHDAGYHDPTALEYPSKEDYSIQILKDIGEKYDISGELIHQAIQGIEGTKIEHSPYKHEISKILRAADINDLGGDYDKMLANTVKIYNEYSHLNQDKLTEKGLYPLPRNTLCIEQSKILQTILNYSREGGISEKYYLYDDFYNHMQHNIDKLRTQKEPTTI